MERSSSWPPAPTIIQPNPASQQRACSAFREALPISAVLHQQVHVPAARAIQRLSRIGSEEAGGRRPPFDARHSR